MGGPGEADHGQVVADTNVIIRIITLEPASQAHAAQRYLDRAATSGTIVYVPDVVVAELAFVLTSVYGLTVSAAAAAIERSLDHPAISLDDPGTIFTALDLWSLAPLDFADAYVAALSWHSSIEGVLSFDRDFDKKLLGVTRIDPAAG